MEIRRRNIFWQFWLPHWTDSDISVHSRFEKSRLLEKVMTKVYTCCLFFFLETPCLWVVVQNFHAKQLEMNSYYYLQLHMFALATTHYFLSLIVVCVYTTNKETQIWMPPKSCSVLWSTSIQKLSGRDQIWIGLNLKRCSNMFYTTAVSENKDQRQLETNSRR